jgi:hypothetical protein
VSGGRPRVRSGWVAVAPSSTLPAPWHGRREDLADYLRAEQRLGRPASAANVGAVATMLIGACHELILPRLSSGSAHVKRAGAAAS